MAEHSKQRVDADNNFLKTQTQALARNRITAESDSVAELRDANTAKLRQLRLAKEASDRMVALAAPPKKARKKPARI
ncbi:hypothetical protein [Bosea sp. (in: a-proteobacteria)]|uniref:hypothetical protein n=1 Tax=Bosea sp. (in: a-proteobacteria) TaxID=1871050 RepID=UPI002733A57C|nr:hypothetical protein [Bosea sp. (in: a-proteobacteria)]MDP3258707.1 hypothetical protein [Bosea sp. (in: a-proteobacteria)]